MLMSRQSLREDILNSGLDVMFKVGYQAATVRDICAAAGAPQGSFTNHFRSKEAFAGEVLDRYFAGTKEFVRQALEDKSLSPRQRLRRYLDIISGYAADREWNLGCLIGDFSLETACTASSCGLGWRQSSLSGELHSLRASPRLRNSVKSIRCSIRSNSPNSCWLP